MFKQNQYIKSALFMDHNKQHIVFRRRKTTSSNSSRLRVHETRLAIIIKFETPGNQKSKVN